MFIFFTILILIAAFVLHTKGLFKELGVNPLVATGIPLAVVLAMATATIVPAGHAGVVITFGSVSKDAIGPGLHFVNPFARVDKVETRTRNYTMSAASDEGNKKGDDSITVITSDSMSLKLDVSVLFAIPKGAWSDIYQRIGTDVEERIVRPEIRATLRDEAAGMTADDLYTKKRNVFLKNVEAKLSEAFQKRGIVMEQVLLRNVLLPDTITHAINDKIAADQAAQKMVFVLQKETQEAERKRIEASGKAVANDIMAKSLTAPIIQMAQIDAMKDIGANKNLIITNGTTPLINVQKNSN